MTIIWLRNGSNFYVQEDYQWVKDRWEVRRAGMQEFKGCYQNGEFCGRITLDLEQISNIHEHHFSVDPPATSVDILGSVAERITPTEGGLSPYRPLGYDLDPPPRPMVVPSPVQKGSK